MGCRVMEILATHQLHRKESLRTHLCRHGRVMESLRMHPHHRRCRRLMESLKTYPCGHRRVMKSLQIMETSRTHLCRHRRKGHNEWHLRDDKVPCSHLVFGKADEIESEYIGHTDMRGGQNAARGPSVLLHPIRMHVLLLTVQLDRHQRHQAQNIPCDESTASWPTVPRCSDDHEHPRRDL